MTQLLFKDNSYIKTFEGTIVNIIEKDSKYLIEMNQTAFYPEGGGQPADIGTIGQADVSYVYKEGGTVYHVVDQVLSLGQTYKCEINWQHRFDMMQQHTGQHVLSATIEQLYDADTIGFHLSDDYTTIDISKKITWQDVHAIEKELMSTINENRQINVLYPTSEALSQMPLRKQPSVAEDIRVIEIDGMDYSPCGGTHTKSLAEVCLIKITSLEKNKKGTRITFLCGGRALEDYQIKTTIVNHINQTLASRTSDLMDKFQQNQNVQDEMRKTIKALNSQIFEFEMNLLKANAESLGDLTVYKKIFLDANMGDVRKTAATLTNEDNVVCLLGIREDDKVSLVIARSKNLETIDAKTIFSSCIKLLDGKGGGNAQSAQGGGPNVDKLDDAIKLAMAHILPFS